MAVSPYTSDNFLTSQIGEPVIPPLWGAQQFETMNRNILDYTKEFLSKNNPRGVYMCQGDIDWYFEGDVRAAYAEGDERRYWLLQQKTSPLIMAFWSMYTNPYEFFKRKANEQIDSFREVARGEDSRVDGTIVLTDAYDEITIPEIGLFSLQNVRYVDVLSRVNNADPVDCFSEATMRRLWQGIVINVFDFEPEWAKKAKLEEVESEEARRYWTWVGGYRVASEARQIPPTPRDFLSSGPRDNRAGIGNEKDIKQHKQHTSAEQIIPRPKAQDKQHRQHAPTGKVSSWLKTQGNQHKQQTSAKRVFPQPKAHVPAMNNALGSGSGEINAGIGNQKDDKQNKQHPSAERIYPRPKAHGPSIRYPPVTPDLGRLREHVLRKRTGVQCFEPESSSNRINQNKGAENERNR